MKYTRYDIKKKNKGNYGLLIVLISVLIASYLLGSGLSSLFIKNAKPTVSDENARKPDISIEQGSTKESTVVKTENIIIKFVCIQNGIFESKENAELLKNKVKEILNPFSVKEESKTRVLAGIFIEGDAQKYIELLNSKGIDNSSIKFELNKNDKCDAEIVEIINGYIKILSELLDRNVKSIQTTGFKQYVSSLEKVEGTSKNYSILEELKKYVGALPEAITRDKTEENYIYLYNILRKVTGK
jgi:hypothetical protein